MTTYIVRRLLQSVVVVVGVSLLVFFILYQTGDPTYLSVSPDATTEEYLKVRHDLGYDRPWIVQYADYFSGMVQGDFGESLRQRRPVTDVIREKLPATLELTVASLAIALAVALPVGIISATKRNSIWDNVAMLFALAGQSVPVFFLGIMLLYIFGGQLGWFPIGGRGTGGIGNELRHLVLPAITLAAFSMARNARLVRSNLLEVLGQDYVRTARAKGLREYAVILRHALKNSLIPVITIIGLEFGALLGGAVVTETVFAWPGVGSMVVRAIGQRDFPVVVGTVTVLSMLFVGINLLVDLTYGYLDPRIRYS
ncbi:MAG: ABC transporter permease [Chloroflexi bacterium]|nr:ABC transporter permease [Chloroflexota bacterium]